MTNVKVINVNDVCFSLFVWPIVDRMQDTVAQDTLVQDWSFLTPPPKKKRGEQESSISKQTDSQIKINVSGSFETESFSFA